jgi:hypothetical protein
VFPVRYELNSYILFRRNSVFKGLSRVYGPIKENGTWRSRYNLELYRLYNEPDIVRAISDGWDNAGS